MRDFGSLVLWSTCALVASVPLFHCSSAHTASRSSAAAASTDDGGIPGYVDCDALAGVPGYLPVDNSLSPMEQIGRCTWVLSTGRTTTNANFATDSTGNPVAATEGLSGTENLIGDVAKKNGIIIPILNILSATSEADRTARWNQYGVMNDPGCTASPTPDQYGLQLDTCIDPNSAGAVGIRKFPNPAFDAARWSALQAQGQDALMQAYTTDATLEPPYLVGQACGGCHTSFDPANPPADPSHPQWANLKFTLGNQYFREGEFFKAATNGPTDFRWHVLDTQEPGTSDTSRIASDNINNPNAINPIYSLLFRPFHMDGLKQGQITFDLTASVCPDLSTNCNAALKIPVTTALALLQPSQSSKAIAAIRQVVQADGEQHPVQSILKGGEDSVGPVGALLRVYVNIGMCSSVWTTHFDPISGMSPQTPIGLEELYGCPSYQQMLNRVPATFLFLASQGPIHLQDVPGGAAHVDTTLASQGAALFAQDCASCHSSKQPPAGTTDVAGWFANAIQQDNWLVGNFLSDDAIHSVVEVGTNASRALHSNHMQGHIWGDAYASQSYDQRTWPGELSLYNPWGAPSADATPQPAPVSFTGPDGGPGYYRTPTLISIWTRAPFLHNKALGQVDPTTNKIVVPGPGVDDRVAAFEADAHMLLSPELRPQSTVNGITYPGYVKTTAQDSVLSFQKLGLSFSINIPAGTPVNLFANLDPNDTATQLELGGIATAEAAASLIGDTTHANFDPTQSLPSDLLYTNMGTHLLSLSGSPDLVENRGHTFGSELTDAQKAALIEYLKTL